MEASKNDIPDLWRPSENSVTSQSAIGPGPDTRMCIPRERPLVLGAQSNCTALPPLELGLTVHIYSEKFFCALVLISFFTRWKKGTIGVFSQFVWVLYFARKIIPAILGLVSLSMSNRGLTCLSFAKEKSPCLCALKFLTSTFSLVISILVTKKRLHLSALQIHGWIRCQGGWGKSAMPK